MTDKQNPHNQGEKVRAALAERADHRLNLATKRAQEIDAGGKFVSMVSDDQWDGILERISNGEIDSHVMKSLGLSPSTLNAKRRRDPEFNDRYKDALEDHYIAIAQDIRMVTRGVDGYSTGDVKRDAIVAKYDLALARAFASKIIGERLQVEHTSGPAPVMLPTIVVPELPAIEDRSNDQSDDEA